MFRSSLFPGRLKKLLPVCLSLLLIISAVALSPRPAAAAVNPLPGPGHPLLYDDFAGGGLFKQNWTNWYNQNGGSGTFTKTVQGTRTIGKFTQTPGSSTSWAKFQPMNETFDLSGYRYMNLSLQNAGYAQSLIRVVISDGITNYNLTGGYVSATNTWTSLQFDLDALSPKIQKEKVKLEVWLRQAGGTYGEMLIDDIVFTTASGGTAPQLSPAVMSADTDGSYNQNTNFTFDATYTDPDNEAPYAVQVIIDDTAYTMRETDQADVTYTDGKDYRFMTKLPAGAHSYYFRTTDTTSNEVKTGIHNLSVVNSSSVVDIVVSQAGYSADDIKYAKFISTTTVTDATYEILDGSNVVSSGTMTYEGFYWNKHVYSIGFSSVTDAGNNYRVRSNQQYSYPFEITPNLWDQYKDEMTAFYRLLRASVATSDAYPEGYSSVAPSAKLYHAAGHLDDAQSADGLTHYDLTGSWYDAGDYGKYGGNQWVGAEIALAYTRYADKDSVKYDNDSNGIPDLVDEAVFGSEYLIKFADQLGGEMYNLRNNASFVHPEKSTDNISGTADDRKLTDLSVGGSAKSAGTLAATARAIRTAVNEGDIASARIAELTDFADQCESAAVIFYEYVVAHPDGPIGSYSTRGGIPNSKLLADVELYLLTGEIQYRNSASATINALTLGDISSTNYWDMSPMSMAEFYPVADAATQSHIHSLLKGQADFFLSTSDDTPYGVLNQFKNFGVNEPHASYLGDLLRYYELFGDPAALEAVVNGMYWLFGENPWNISWVSGIGTHHVMFPHTRYNEDSNTAGDTGIIFPGAMVSGPNMKDPKNRTSISPWYEDRSLYLDDTNQWRYNEFSISIQAGLLYTVMGLSATPGTGADNTAKPPALPLLSPVIGEWVRGDVTVFAEAGDGLSQVEYAAAGLPYQPMTVSGNVYSTVSGAVYAAVIDESQSLPYTNRRVDVRAKDSSGGYTYSSTHYTVAPALPDPSTPLLYDDFGGGGFWGGSAANTTWVNWYNQNGGTGTFTKLTADGRSAGKFAQTPSAVNSAAKFQPWNDVVDLSGYRYLNITLKNPASPDLRTRIEINDGKRTYNLTGGWAEVPSDWNDLQFDLNALTPAIDKKALKLSIWLKQNSVTAGEMLIDEIKATNQVSGSAPTLTSGGVNHTAGTPQTEFTFTVTYTDVDNQAPFAMELVLDGVVRTMQPANPGDTNYVDGRVYQYTIKLPPGQHSYYFHTTDTFTDAISTEVQSGPEVSLGS
ncbi:hypothetical protein QW71_01615 [Paenibacillus sp. IHB B 3415]|uniref:glycoside hydrolase family 9 protein n=1 Tax=Paenibacillus sp. IHB B 3415 TaxID=867080 RepID=UPI000574B6E4|nr:glycoside hydrolase family 9 protein [Paenibacillus sp. IHB B 3415]KHL97498.1 hypothetical protein QW71_01615 [Paenibacillus sp. IHB B 3415]